MFSAPGSATCKLAREQLRPNPRRHPVVRNPLRNLHECAGGEMGRRMAGNRGSFPGLPMSTTWTRRNATGINPEQYDAFRKT